MTPLDEADIAADRLLFALKVVFMLACLIVLATAVSLLADGELLAGSVCLAALAANLGYAHLMRKLR